jgi:hypothetical protein
VASHHRGTPIRGRFGQELEDEAVLRILRSCGQGQPELKQGVEQPVLRQFHHTPGSQVGRDRRVRDDAVVSARGAVRLVRGGWDEPVAGIELRIGAEAVGALGLGQRTPSRVAIGFQRRERAGIGLVALAITAALAGVVLEVEELAAGLALEALHRGIPCADGPRHGGILRSRFCSSKGQAANVIRSMWTSADQRPDHADPALRG